MDTQVQKSEILNHYHALLRNIIVIRGSKKNLRVDIIFIDVPMQRIDIQNVVECILNVPYWDRIHVKIQNQIRIEYFLHYLRLDEMIQH